MGIVYLLTNTIYEKENYFKIGITDNPFERLGIQKNSSPIDIYYKIVIFSKDYKKIEKWIGNKFEKIGIYGGGNEWVKEDFENILSIYKEALNNFADAELCYNGRRYVNEKGIIVEKKLPNCNLGLLGISNGKEIKCIVNGEIFIVKDNGIMVNGKPMSLTYYMNEFHKRNTQTNQHNGYQYFTYKNRTLYDMWQKIVNAK